MAKIPFCITDFPLLLLSHHFIYRVVRSTYYCCCSGSRWLHRSTSCYTHTPQMVFRWHCRHTGVFIVTADDEFNRMTTSTTHTQSHGWLDVDGWRWWGQRASKSKGQRKRTRIRAKSTGIWTAATVGCKCVEKKEKNKNKKTLSRCRLVASMQTIQLNEMFELNEQRMAMWLGRRFVRHYYKLVCRSNFFQMTRPMNKFLSHIWTTNERTHALNALRDPSE